MMILSRICLLSILILGFLQSYSQDTIQHTGVCAFKEYEPLPENPPCDLGLFFSYESDSLRIHGTIGANCCGDHFAIIEKVNDTIFINTIDTGELCTCVCAYCFEIKIQASQEDSLVSINGQFYNIANTSLSSIFNINEQREYDCFPNPCTDFLIINTKGKKINTVLVSDLSGKILFQETSIYRDQVFLDTHRYKSGVYILRINSMAFRFVKL